MLESRFSCVLQLPTGSGKTWLSKRAISHVLNRGLRAVYLTPIRALADELYPAWQKEFAPYPVGIFTGDYGKDGKDYPVPFADARVMIMTPERLDASTRAWRSHWNWIPEVDLVVVDEVHLLGDSRRGARLEGAISRFRRLNPLCRFLCLSATLGNREELADWLDGIEYTSDWRSVPLTWRVTRYRKADEKPGLLAKEIERNRTSGGRSLVFVQSRRRCEVLSGFLRDQGIRASYHHAGLTHAARRKVEKTFRSSELDALVATGTLEMGLNMPVRQVVLYDAQMFDGSQFAPLSVNTVWQRAGRAGRPGLDASGEAVLLVPSWDKSADGYMRGRFERIESGLAHPAALAEQIVAEIGSGLCRSEAQLKRALGGTLAAFQRKALPVDPILHEMLQAGMIRSVKPEDGEEYKKERLAATPLGRIATRQLLQPATVLMARTFMEQVPDFTHFDLLFALCLTPDCEPVIPVDFEELSSLAEQLDGTRSQVVPRLGQLRSLLRGASGKRLLSAMKSAALLLTWCATGDEESTAKRYGVYPFEIVRLRESLDRLLMAGAAICKIVFEKEDQTAGEAALPKLDVVRRIELLRSMVMTGLPARTASLTLLEGVGPKWARKLNDHGYEDLAVLARATLAEVEAIPGLSRKRAMLWLCRAKELAGQPIPSTEEAAPKICTHASKSERTDADPYRMRRARDLAVAAAEDGGFIVTGGLEPHRVRPAASGWTCDCPDHAKGHICKHILAVRRKAQEENALDMAGSPSPDGALDLMSLWVET
jgi:helicase